MGLLKQEYHSAVYYGALLLLAASLPLSKVGMSVAQLTLMGNWILEGQLKQKTRSFFRNRAAMAACLLFAVHLAGMLYTADLGYGMKDLRIKLPLIALPVILSTSGKISLAQFRTILITHALAVIAGTFSGVFLLLTNSQISDAREISVFISHIRFSLNVSIAFFSLGYFAIARSEMKKIWRYLSLAGSLWMVSYLAMTGSLTGLGLIVLCLFFIALYKIFTLRPRKIKIILSVFLSVALVVTFLYVRDIAAEVYATPAVDIGRLETKTSRGNTYSHNPLDKQTENGNLLWLYVCFDEIEKGWNERSTISFDSLDRSGQPVKYTLIRYMTSLGLRKDMDGIMALSENDVRNVENGIANYRHTENTGLRNRIAELIWEFRNYNDYGDPRGLTLMQRVELWRVGWQVMKNHLFTGVGTGDIKNVFAAGLLVYHSPLEGSGMRAHNQYLTFIIAFGLPGFIVILFSLFYPVSRCRSHIPVLTLVFFIIVMYSMFTEDTLESQPGVTLFAFFYSLYLFVSSRLKT